MSPRQEFQVAEVRPFQLRLDRAAEYIDASPETLRYWARNGKIPHVRMGRGLYFLVSDLEEFCRSQRKTAASVRFFP